MPRTPILRAAALLSLTGVLSATSVPQMAMAQDVYTLPEGCTAYMTMQSASCSVGHYFTCEGDEEGSQRRVEFDREGVSYVGQIDGETQWLISSYRDTGHTEVLEDDPADRASFTELLEEGISTYDFRTLSDEIGPMRYVGADILTGETVTIDGVELVQTEYTIRMEDPSGQVLFSTAGREFVSVEWRVFFGGVSTLMTEQGEVERDNSPVEFILPGEPGFLSSSPKYGCGATDSSWETN